MSLHPAHDRPAPDLRMPPVTWPILGAAGAIIAAAWAVTLATSADFGALLVRQARGAAPTEAAAFVALSAVMMVAMMLPSAIPMVETYRGLVKLEAGPREALVRASLFSTGYLAVWTAMTALSLPLLMAVGWMGAMGGAAAYVPGAVLVAAGLYQFSWWKEYCLRHCRSPLSYMTLHYRTGRLGGARMGLSHAFYCLGCCWLLMLVWFVAGAMSALWMGVFAAFILAEKVAPRGALLSRAMGAVSVGAGALLIYFVASAPAM